MWHYLPPSQDCRSKSHPWVANDKAGPIRKWRRNSNFGNLVADGRMRFGEALRFLNYVQNVEVCV